MTDPEFQFEAPKGSRVHRYFHGITVMPPGPNRWWLRHHKCWVEDFRADDRWHKGCSSHARCRTLRAFRRHIRRHRHELAGCTVVLVSNYVGHNVTVTL